MKAFMIDFACTCGHAFHLPDDQAGTEFQCPQCHRLVDVPTLNDLRGIQADGTYALEEAKVDPDVQSERFDRMVAAFDRGKYDEFGDEKDWRQTNDDLENVGAPLGVDGAGRERLPPPKYDPVTGELLRPIELAPVPVRPVKPLPEVYQQTGPMLSYAVAVGTARTLGWKSVWIELFTAPNMMVMLFPLACHLFIEACLMIIGFIFPLGGLMMAVFAIMAHYGAVPVEIGTEDKDDLPRPLGSLSWADDLWNPFCNLFFSLVICYGPALIPLERLRVTPEGVFISGCLVAGGTLLFPAVFLTMCTGGTILNLRPDRVLGVVRVAGGYYIGLAAEWIAVIVVYLGSAVMLHLVASNSIGVYGPRKFWVLGLLLTLCAGIYLVHLFLWHLGLLYRGKSAVFPWVLQHHTRSGPRAERRLTDEDRATRRAKVRRKYMNGEGTMR